MCLKNIEKLRERLSDHPKPVVIVTHDNPDPDAIAASLGMRRIVQSINPDVECDVIYGGEISHPQNKTLMNVLGVNITTKRDVFEGEAEKKDYEEKYGTVIVVDTIPERCLPKGIKAFLTIDHHRNETKNSELQDIREVGASASIVWEYMASQTIKLSADVDTDSSLATAMLVGIKTDTQDLVSENTKDIDFTSYKHLLEYVNRRQLSSIINYPIPPYHFDLRSKLDNPENFKIDNGVFVGGLGYMMSSRRDAIATLAEERARMEGVDTAFVFGIVDDCIVASVRSNGVAVDVNALCQRIFGKEYGGGKMNAGAARVPLSNFLFDVTDCNKEKMWDAIKSCLIEVILKKTQE